MRRIDLSAYQSKFTTLIYNYLSVHGMEQQKLSGLVGIQPIELSNLLTGKRKLSANYLMPFIVRGVIRVEQLYDGNKDVSDKELEFWSMAKIMEEKELLIKIARLRSRGVSTYDMYRVLDTLNGGCVQG